MEGFCFLGIYRYVCGTSSLRFLFGAINVMEGFGNGGLDTNFLRLFAILSLIVKNKFHNSIFNETSHFLCVYDSRSEGAPVHEKRQKKCDFFVHSTFQIK